MVERRAKRLKEKRRQGVFGIELNIIVVLRG